VNQRFHVLHAQRLFWKPYGKNALCWAFYVINDNTQVGGKVPQSDALHVMSQIIVSIIARTKLYMYISYFKSNGIIA